MTVTATPAGLATAEPRFERRMKLRHIANHVLIFAVLIGLWELAAATGFANPLLFPRPSGIAVSLVRIFFIQANIWWHLFVTLAEVLIGFLIGSALGMGLAIAAGLNETIRRYMKPYVVILEATPRIAIGPLMIAWFGFGWNGKIAIITLVVFFAPFVNTLTGMLTVDEEAHEMLRSMRATKSQIFWKLQLPSSVPIIMAGLRLAMASALGGALVAEFISADEGIGVILTGYTATLNMNSAFATLLTLTAAGFLLYRLMEIIERRVVFWEYDGPMDAVGRKRAAKWRRATA